MSTAIIPGAPSRRHSEEPKGDEESASCAPYKRPDGEADSSARNRPQNDTCRGSWIPRTTSGCTAPVIPRSRRATRNLLLALLTNTPMEKQILRPETGLRM